MKNQSLYQRQEITWRWYAKPTKANDGKADNNKQSRIKCSNSIDESNQNWISNNFLSSVENAYLFILSARYHCRWHLLQCDWCVSVFFSVAFQSTIVHIQYNMNATATDCCLPGWPLFSQRNILRDLTYLVQIDMLLLLHCHKANDTCEIMFQSIIGVIISINNLNRIFMFLNNRRKKVLLSLSYTILQHRYYQLPTQIQSV